jgi:hypothetical protein
MPCVYCGACGAGFDNNVRSCPTCGARTKRVHERRGRRSHPNLRLEGEDIELEVRDALYGPRYGTVERLPAV